MDKLKRRGILFVLSSPSGAGKTSIARYILDQDKNINLSVSLTTRKKRKNEKAGIDYVSLQAARVQSLGSCLLQIHVPKITQDLSR